MHDVELFEKNSSCVQFGIFHVNLYHPDINQMSAERGKQGTEATQSPRSKAGDLKLSKHLAQNINHA